MTARPETRVYCTCRCCALTYGGVSDKGLLVGHDCVDGHLLVVLRRDDGDGGLQRALHARHLFDHGHVVLVGRVHAPVRARTAVNACQNNNISVDLPEILTLE